MNARARRADSCNLAALAVPGVAELQPYQPGKPIAELEREYGIADIIKLASNENPLGCSPLALEAMQRELPSIAQYPDGSGHELRHALAARHGVAPECITLGNGSNDVLVLLAEAFLRPGLEAVVSRYCFAVYPLACQAVGATLRVAATGCTPGGTDLSHDLGEMRALVNEATRMVFIANPNNPTGSWLDEPSLKSFIGSLAKDVLVVVDEAYHEYAVPLGAADASTWLSEFPNLVVTRTFSKAFGLAGARVGYSLSSAPVADVLNRIRQPFNVNSLGLAGARAALEDEAFIAHSVRTNADGLQQLGSGLVSLGLVVEPSAGNFVLVGLGRPIQAVYEGLLARGVIVRPVGNYGLEQHLRITVGTAEQNAILLRALAEVLDGGHG
ncbi:MAG: histidinol-phosphate transaminase [Xanthomonadales bacterium]|nr:histidinol-phosphate transaminase [Xanthomonadales bacterium]NIN74879.1 histidinol-phosphate transaminase [Xanthomonadales bacterium]NIO14963.1 histidinol-phosphate transaminase [Xanthomonadales bacterium]NIP11906.1 histidinol-phosphate transaminase [Xanthomonadales bacterium]NIP77204.1 histidinol-phosphate transaminase [Xanthomonadales bacterium]